MGLGAGALIAGLFGMNVSLELLCAVYELTERHAVDKPLGKQSLCVCGNVAARRLNFGFNRIPWLAEVGFFS